METDNLNPNDALRPLQDYIRQQLHTGLQPDEIHTQLTEAGWPADIIQQAFTQAHVAGPPITAVEPAQSSQEPLGASQTQPMQPPRVTVQRGRFKTGWLLFKQSVQVLRNNGKLMRYVLMSLLLSLVLTLIFAAIFVADKNMLLKTASTSASGSHLLKPAGFVVAIIYYILAFFIVNFYSAGLAANVLDLFRGSAKPYDHYIAAARSRWVPLFTFSVIEATIGLLLRAIAERSKLLGRIIISIVGVMWSLARLFVVPIIVTSDDNAVAAIKQSTKLLIATWGENLVGRVSFGVIALLAYLVLIPVSILLIILGSVGGGVGIVTAVVLVVLLYAAFAILFSTAGSVLNTALFYYAQYHQIPAAFDPDLINSVFIHRKKRGLLGTKTASS
jgi:hypothetical protein